MAHEVFSSTGMRAMGHHIKSSAVMMGAADFTDLCRALETNPDDMNRARELMRQMQALMAEVEGQIEAQFS